MVNLFPEQLHLLCLHVSPEESFKGAPLAHSHVTVDLEDQHVELVLTKDLFSAHILKKQFDLAHSLFCTSVTLGVVG